MGSFHTIVAIIGTLIIAISFLVAFLIRKNTNTPQYLKYFYVYPLFALLVSLHTLVLMGADTYRDNFGAVAEKCIVVVDFVLWGLFFTNLFRNNISAAIKNITNFIFPGILILVILGNIFSKSAYNGLGYANVGKSLFCILYFYSLFRSAPSLNLRYEPAFWIVTGLLFYSALSIPVYLSIAVFYANNYVNLIGILFPLTNIIIILMHLLFIKGYLCKIQQHKTF